ncbi:MAG: bifunctional phosphopantothenoylcysteine decarboxylase/phosphopantothenate--cysteine ligase CoaBC [Thiotrichales bacterium]|jgi:phosphopantothenoylcysteine decarboxylase/phosphopantothenate--cysteine ligase|nr:bifunctional phosphopantothenoylcysteine decarboxylase/phosphopantothenate--cysteine ligase CoaBC [Thiotrichales bacterium]MBT3855129.1 bifunctional phosphopantothenoylcysteine decarboxylase/phosphopantothenate--cysteine ligase CoaBC [Thiotrichales bacterium]MBT4653644.1 bifunctional phosphopantothenoylcysteine decarboxylase/phosphopantothenate--cysteine ligase CoaBC [Thiotrichales bacterium]MBT5984882.1 bifunctional phosphopantothenoylcysteine decarboxylase/phosphopantothenate--cysteine liga|tara:strand:- start:2247 stop:3440 length:1194 start_codon:yes stop_codon:yes gene_type:complete
MNTLTNKRVLLGVSGSIAAYKSPDIVRRLQDLGAEVRVIVTDGGKEFVSERSLQTISKNKVHSNLWDKEAELSMGHIELAKWSDIIIIAPASANTIAKLCHGRADDLLSTVILATDAKVMLAPSMNQQMFASKAMKDNLKILLKRGIVIIEPGFGEQACGDVGEGRLAEPLEIAKQAADLFTSNTLSGKKVLITLGGTIEAIDPVRYISNHSSGKMGMALAHECIQAGAKTTLIVGSISIDIEKRAEVIHIVSAKEMYEAVMKKIEFQDLFISCAAVADFRPKNVSTNKIKKNNNLMTIELTENIDILASVCRLNKKPICIGFAAETENFISNAKAKLKSKMCEAIILNDISQSGIGLNSNENEVHFITKENCEKIEKNSKQIIAEKIIEKITNYYF